MGWLCLELASDKKMAYSAGDDALLIGAWVGPRLRAGKINDPAVVLDKVLQPDRVRWRIQSAGSRAQIRCGTFYATLQSDDQRFRDSYRLARMIRQYIHKINATNRRAISDGQANAQEQH